MLISYSSRVHDFPAARLSFLSFRFVVVAKHSRRFYQLNFTWPPSLVEPGIERPVEAQEQSKSDLDPVFRPEIKAYRFPIGLFCTSQGNPCEPNLG